MRAFESQQLAPTKSRGYLIEQRAPKRVRLGGIDVYVGKLPDQLRVIAAEVDDTIVLGSALQFARIFFRVVGDQNPLGRTHHLPADFEALLIQAMLQRV